MTKKDVFRKQTKHIALIAHDNCKGDLLEWVQKHQKALADHHLFGTGTTGRIVAERTKLPVHRFRSGPLGGDQQVGAKISEGEIDFLIFFWDPLEAQPHDPDVKALLRLAVVWNIPVACNPVTADFVISSPLFHQAYRIQVDDYEAQRESFSMSSH